MKALAPVLAVMIVLVVTLQSMGHDGEDEEVCCPICGPVITLKDTPNPGGNANQINGSDEWAMDAGEAFQAIEYKVTLKNSNPAQTTQASITTSPPNQNWSITLTVAAGTYNPTKATLYSLKCGTVVQRSVTGNKDQKVN